MNYIKLVAGIIFFLFIVTFVIMIIPKRQILNEDRSVTVLIDPIWYSMEYNRDGQLFSWLSNNGTIKIFNNRNENFNLTFNLEPFFETKNVMIINNGNPNYYKISRKERIILPINENETNLLFIANEKCKKPKDLLKISSDTRCLNIAISDILIEK